MVVSILGGIGLFMLGMVVMTDGLRATAASALRTVLAKATPTPARGAFWGAVVTLIMQSSSATTMTTIGLVSAGLLTFPQSLGIIFGANIGTTSTGWLVALAGVKFSLTGVALPMVFLGTFARLLGSGRLGGAGSVIAGLGLLLFGLTVLQEGMAGLAAKINPTDFPKVTDGWRSMLGVLQLVVVGFVMTTVMQSSSAAVAATLSALHAGAIGPDQAAALVIGQNLGTTVSAGLASIGATTPARRTALAHILFNGTTAALVIPFFPLMAPLINGLAADVEPTILLATFHTAYNVVGLAVLLPFVAKFAALVERIVPQRGPVLTRFLDRSVLDMPAVAVESARVTVAALLHALAIDVASSLESMQTQRNGAARRKLHATTHRIEEALNETQTFLSKIAGPPTSEAERSRLANVLHALDHLSRLNERIEEALDEDRWRFPFEDAEVVQAMATCVDALRLATGAAARVAEPGVVADAALMEVVQALATRSAEQAALRRAHRPLIMQAAARAEIAPDAAIRRADAMRLLDRLGYHTWRAMAHLAGAPDESAPGTAA